MQEKRGKFIVFEGIDGCGKSTQIPLILDYLLKKNKYNHVLVTREPYKSREIRKILRQEESAYSRAEKLAELFVQDRREHANEIILPSLRKGIHVISDRYVFSTIAYQSVQGISIDKLVEMHKGLLIPDATFIVDLPSEVAKKRMLNDKRSEQKFEADLDFQEKVRKRYLEIPKIMEGNIIILDGAKTIEQITEDIIHELEKGVFNKTL